MTLSSSSELNVKSHLPIAPPIHYFRITSIKPSICFLRNILRGVIQNIVILYFSVSIRVTFRFRNYTQRIMEAKLFSRGEGLCWVKVSVIFHILLSIHNVFFKFKNINIESNSDNVIMMLSSITYVVLISQRKTRKIKKRQNLKKHYIYYQDD